MSVDWGDWSAFEESPGQPLSDVDRVTARRYFEALMAARAERTQQLERLLARNGVEIGAHDMGLQRLDDWYSANVAASDSAPDRLADRWYAIGLDIGLYLGEAILGRAPRLEWRLFIWGRRDASYQRPVIMGFTKVANQRYNVDPERLVGIHGHRIVAGEDEPRDAFAQIVVSAIADA